MERVQNIVTVQAAVTTAMAQVGSSSMDPSYGGTGNAPITLPAVGRIIEYNAVLHKYKNNNKARVIDLVLSILPIIKM